MSWIHSFKYEYQKALGLDGCPTSEFFSWKLNIFILKNNKLKTFYEGQSYYGKAVSALF